MQTSKIAAEGKLINDIATPINRLPTVVVTQNEQKLIDRYSNEFASASDAIQQSGSVELVQLELGRFETMPEEHRKLVAGELDKLHRSASRRIEQLLYDAVTNAEKLGTGLTEAIEKYLTAFPEGSYADDVKEKLNDVRQARYLAARARVRNITVTTASSLLGKKVAIEEFLAEYGNTLDHEERDAISFARDIATDLLTPRQYRCKLIRTKGLDRPRDHGVQIFVDGKRLANFDDSGPVREKNWNRDFTVTWQAGEAIRVTLVNFTGWNQDMAYFDGTNPIAIRVLATTSEPSRYAEYSGWSWLGGTDFQSEQPPFEVEFTCAELPEAKLRIISDYILPGEAW